MDQASSLLRPIRTGVAVWTAAALGLAGCGGAATRPSSPGGVGTGGSGGAGGAAGSGSGGASGGSGGSPAGPPLGQVTLRTALSGQFLARGTGAALAADSDGQGAAASFTLTDVDGGALADGDLVYLAVGGSYLSAAGGGGGALAFSAAVPGDDESFLITRVDGPGTIAAGDRVAFKTKVGGQYVSAIDGGGGDVLANAPWDRTWESFTLAPAGGGATGTSARARVLAFLSSQRGKRTAIGIEDKDAFNPTSDSDQMASLAGTGGYPSFWSGDWGFGSNLPQARESLVKAGIAQWQKGALVQYIYHACPPTMGANEGCSYEGDPNGNDIKGSRLTDAQWSDLVTAGGTLNRAWLARLDLLAQYFGELKAAGVAPLFRPLHEINGDDQNGGYWAWWQGRPGPNGSARLYQITHDYLVTQKGLDNIIWVYNLQDYATLSSDVTSFSPGPSYFDIVALDVYDGGYTTSNYDALLGVAAGRPIGVAECYTMMTASVLASQPLWSYIAMWPDQITQNGNPAILSALFQDDQVLMRSQMPGWY